MQFNTFLQGIQQCEPQMVCGSLCAVTLPPVLLLQLAMIGHCSIWNTRQTKLALWWV